MFKALALEISSTALSITDNLEAACSSSTSYGTSLSPLFTEIYNFDCISPPLAMLKGQVGSILIVAHHVSKHDFVSFQPHAGSNISVECLYSCLHCSEQEKKKRKKTLLE